MKTVIALALTALGLAIPATANADPVGYGWCGDWDRETRMFNGTGEDEAGLPVLPYAELWAKNLSCEAAERNYKRIKWDITFTVEKSHLAGYTCKALEQGLEFLDLRCIKRNRPNTKFRVQSGV